MATETPRTAADQAQTPPSQDVLAMRALLYTNLNDKCNEDELRTFCFRLAVDYESLTGDTKSTKAQNLIIGLEQRGKVAELLNVGVQVRSDLTWQLAGPAQADSTQQSNYSEVVNTGLKALLTALQTPGVDELAHEFEHDFEQAQVRVARISRLKRLNVAFNSLESLVSTIQRETRPLAATDKIPDGIKDNLGQLADAVAAVHSEMSAASFMGDAQIWAERLDRGGKDLQTALATGNLEPLFDARDRFQRVLMLAPGYVNAWFIAVIDDLLRSKLEDRLEQFHKQLVTLRVDDQTAQEFMYLIEAIVGIKGNLRQRTQAHDGWHSSQEELRYINKNLKDLSIGQVIDAWNDIRGTVRDLIGPSREDWALQMVRLEETLQGDLEESLKTNETQTSQRWAELLAQYVTHVELQRRGTFQMLLEDVKELQDIDDDLSDFMDKLRKAIAAKDAGEQNRTA